MFVLRPIVLSFICIGICQIAVNGQDQVKRYDYASNGTRYLEFGGGASSFKILLEESNLGGKDLEMAEHSFAPGTDIRGHAHGSTEIFYVLSGELEHTVNGEKNLLTPGMVGVVRPGDEVIHRVPSETTPARVLIIWTPAGEIERIFKGATERALDIDD